MNIGEINGVQVAVSPEAYEKIRKQKIIEENKILKELQQELERYKNITEIHEKYFELINDLAFDYDGCETTGDLMNLIDELKKYASLGRVANTTEVIYVSGNNKKYNILHEELKGSDSNE